MPVRLLEILDGHSRHQKVSQHAILDDFDSLRWSAFVIVFVIAGEFSAIQLAQAGIVGDAQKFWQYLLANLLSEGLAFLFVALPVAFEAMAEHFVKENG